MDGFGVLCIGGSSDGAIFVSEGSAGFFLEGEVSKLCWRSVLRHRQGGEGDFSSFNRLITSLKTKLNHRLCMQLGFGGI